MKKIMLLCVISALLICCNSNPADKRIVLQSDTLNVVKLTDTLMILESTCRGCEYEESTNFGISDSMNIIQLQKVITKDKSPANMDGGSISKTLVLFSTKTGKTSFKLYKFWESQPTAKDSALFTRYNIEVTN